MRSAKVGMCRRLRDLSSFLSATFRSRAGAAPAAQPFATFGTGTDQVRVQGQIDRIDVGRRGTATAFAVVDYKIRAGHARPQRRARGARAAAGHLRRRDSPKQTSRSRRGLVPNAVLEPDAKRFWPALKGNKSKRWEPVDPSVVTEIEKTLHELLRTDGRPNPPRRIPGPQCRRELHRLVQLQHGLSRGPGAIVAEERQKVSESGPTMNTERTYTPEQAAAIDTLGLDRPLGRGRLRQDLRPDRTLL